MAFYNGAECAQLGGIEQARGRHGGGGFFYELRGAGGVVECGVFFRVGFFAAVMKNGGGDGKRIVGRFLGRAGHVEQVEREAHHGFGVAHEATGAK